jgi:hypothetical protein
MLKIADVKSDDQARVPVCRAVLGFRHGTRGMSLKSSRYRRQRSLLSQWALLPEDLIHGLIEALARRHLHGNALRAGIHGLPNRRCPESPHDAADKLELYLLYNRVIQPSSEDDLFPSTGSACFTTA